MLHALHNDCPSLSLPPVDENGEESDEPPKVEVQEIKETDAFYSKKCKLFYKKETEFKEKGVGTLHLKTTSEGKTQLLVRADTNLGMLLTYETLS
uniref:RanBD1 domain-containing protein n=1 Tax=Hucho hucho TaxID=62062 RepID=A0A4W5KAY2_9TELE